MEPKAKLTFLRSFTAPFLSHCVMKRSSANSMLITTLGQSNGRIARILPPSFCTRRRTSPPNATQEQTGGCCRGSALKRLALLEASCQCASEDFVPPAAQRGSVRWTGNESPKPRGSEVTGRTLKQVAPAQHLESTFPWTVQRLTNHRQELAKVGQSCRPCSKNDYRHSQA